LISIVDDAYLHNSIPVVSSGNAEKCQECHSKITEMGVFIKSNTRVLQRAFYDFDTNMSLIVIHITAILHDEMKLILQG